MFPVSPEARAKMKMTRGHAELLPDSSSLRTLSSNWRASRATATVSGAGIAIGDAAANAARIERMVKIFMLVVEDRCMTKVKAF
jgi:hypothetical protein